MAKTYSLVHAKEPFWLATKDGRGRQITPDDIFEPSAKEVKGREHLFEPLQVGGAAPLVHRAVEQTTAAPGEVRNVSPPEEE